MEDGAGAEEYVFRPSKKLFIFGIITSLLLVWLIIGIPLFFVYIIWYKFDFITVGKQGIHIHRGWISVLDRQIPYEKVNSIEVQQSVMDRILGCGTVKIFAGNDVQGILFKGIDKPQEIKQLIEKNIAHLSKQTTVNSAKIPNTKFSGADEIEKYAALKDKGVITQEEFDIKKNQLLG